MIRPRHIRMGFRYLFHCFRRRHPFEVEAALLNKCNLDCIYCRCPSKSNTELATREWKRIIRNFASLGALRFKLHGGEPTLRKDFYELTKEIQDAGMISAAVTNGLLAGSHPELLDHLDEVVLSFDSPREEMNDRTRGRGSHAAVMRTLGYASARGVRAYVNMVVTRLNLDDLERMLEFCEARGIAMNAQPVVFGGIFYNDRARSLALTDAEIRSMHQRLARWKQEGRALLFSTQAYKKVLEWPDYGVISEPTRKASSCVAGKSYLRIEPNGDVIPCCQYSGDFVPMNIIVHGLERSLDHVRTHRCDRCWLPYYNERNALFKLRIPAVAEAFRRG